MKDTEGGTQILHVGRNSEVHFNLFILASGVIFNIFRKYIQCVEHENAQGAKDVTKPHSCGTSSLKSYICNGIKLCLKTFCIEVLVTPEIFTL